MSHVPAVLQGEMEWFQYAAECRSAVMCTRSSGGHSHTNRCFVNTSSLSEIHLTRTVQGLFTKHLLEMVTWPASSNQWQYSAGHDNDAMMIIYFCWMSMLHIVRQPKLEVNMQYVCMLKVLVWPVRFMLKGFWVILLNLLTSSVVEVHNWPPILGSYLRYIRRPRTVSG